MPPGVTRLLGRLLGLGLPFGLWLLVYLVTDPFCLLRSYPDYHGQGLTTSRDYLSTEFLLRNHQRQKFNSFVLGNSRTLAFRSQDWMVHLPPGAVVFSYGCYSDNLFGITRKLELVDHLGLSIDNLLLLFDYTSVVGVEDSTTYFFREHPRVSGASSWEYQLSMARAFFSLQSMRSVWQTKPWQRSSGEYYLHFDPIHNDIVMDRDERLLAQDEQAFFQQRRDELSSKPEIPWGPVIYQPEQFQLLQSLQTLLKKHNTRYKIVLAPTLQPVPLNPQDISHLQRIFGADHVYNYTGSSDITADPHNWYDPMHFRPHVGRRILAQIYADGKH